MRRPAVLVLAAVVAAALAVTTWLVREMRTAQATSGVVAAPALPTPAPPALAPAGAADHLPSRATATAGAPCVPGVSKCGYPSGWRSRISRLR
jgi:hypothetical protein